MAIIKLSKNERRRLSVFFTCLALAFVAWMFTMLSKNYPYTFKAALVYTNAPIHRSFRALQADSADVTVQGSGWNLLFSAMKLNNQTIPVNLKNLDFKNFIVLNTQLKSINEKWASDQQIISFNPDTLYFDFSSRVVKRVPIQLLSNIKFRHQYAFSGNALLNPDYVTISGPANILANINAWKTDSLALIDIADTIRRTIKLQPVSQSNINIYPKTVQVKLPVDEYTEKTIYIPVKLANNKDYYNVKVFPKKVKVTFTVPLGKYTATDESFFEAVADLNLWHDQGLHQLPVKTVRVPAFCKIVKIEPQNIDFIVNQ
ncbi:YbbR-like domain-containing protein [Mucilaginibacter sp. HMF5004]|uniref:CdaR family protein n=1 Tax=Mucilaginibacter rivuli TaxID=2857527 RepID=UPI001C5F09E6|nr:YbbR-like domain-containing protein [Mucilaginibacter rivuli]MBW4891369.1 YbbR-like domain-containing protein [Mucilaginibacter rivuli]